MNSSPSWGVKRKWLGLSGSQQPLGYMKAISWITHRQKQHNKRKRKKPTISFGHPMQNPAAATAAKSLQSCPTLCDPIDGSPPGSPIPGILQARTLEWVAISFSSAWKCSLPGSSIHGIFQARVLEWGAIAFSECRILELHKIYTIFFPCWTIFPPNGNLLSNFPGPVVGNTHFFSPGASWCLWPRLPRPGDSTWWRFSSVCQEENVVGRRPPSRGL